MYLIKNFKSFKGHEGEPCGQGSLHGPSGKVGDWSDDSWGGELRVDFMSPEAERAFVEWAPTFLANHRDFEGKAYVVTSMSSRELIHRAVEHLSYEHEHLAAETKAAKKGIAFYRSDATAENGRALYTTTAPYTAKNVARLRQAHADLLEIVNERLGMPLVDEAAYELAERNKRWMKECKRRTVLVMRKPDGTTQEMAHPAPYSAVLASQLRSKYPDIVEIVNERFL